MNKKEVLEIRKQYTPERCTISRICGCYIDGEKNIKLETKDAFLSLPEEEVFKYLTIFKQTLSGTIGKNLLNMEFPLEAESAGGSHDFLMKLRDSRLQDEALVKEFYQKVIEHFDYGENYYIILIHVSYDVPGRASDGLDMDDASDQVYEYLLCSICPVHLSKEGLCYNAQSNAIENRIRDWIVEPPMKGFLFPVFNDRMADIHGVLYYSKNPEELQQEFIAQVLGCGLPMSAKSQKETFQTLLAETMGDQCDYEIVRNVHEALNEMLEEAKDAPEPLELSGTDVKKLLENSGVEPKAMEDFDTYYEEAAGEKGTFLASNIAETRKFQIETPDVSIKVSSDRADLIETRIIDGKPYLLIEINDQLEVNGVNVRTIAPVEDDFYGQDA